MKRMFLLFAFTLTICSSYAAIKTDTLLKEIKTNKLNAMGYNATAKYTFHMYKDSIVKTFTGGMGYKAAVKQGLELSTTYKIKSKIEKNGSETVYTYEEGKNSIRVVDGVRQVVLHRIKDSFSGQITEMLYYIGL